VVRLIVLLPAQAEAVVLQAVPHLVRVEAQAVVEVQEELAQDVN